MARTQIRETLLATGGGGTTFLGIGKNRVINGDMVIDQRNGGGAVSISTGTTAYSVDQFAGSGTSSAGVFSLQRTTSTPPTGFTHFLRATCTTADASIASGDSYFIDTRIEGYNVRDCLFGSANTKTITLSFWVRSSLTGTYTGAFRNGAGNRAYVFEYIINSANTWEYKTVTLAGDTTGTWATDNTIGLRIVWALALGSSFTASPNTWAGAGFGSSNQVNFMSSNASRTFDITGVQLEIGSSATAFEYRPFQIELALCQRYYEKSYDLDQAPGTVTATGTLHIPMAGATTSGIQYGTIQYRVHKRTTPTMTGYHDNGTNGSWQVRDNGSLVGVGAPQFDQIGPYNSRIRIISISPASITASSSSNWYTAYGHWVADASL